MQTNPEAQHSLRLKEKVPLKEIELEAETPDVSMNSFEKVIDVELKELGMYKRYFGRMKIRTCTDPAVFLTDLVERIEQLDIKIEQDHDQNERKIKQWLQTGETEDLRYANSNLKKNYKQLERLVIENILYRNFFNDDGTVKTKQLFVPQKL